MHLTQSKNKKQYNFLQSEVIIRNSVISFQFSNYKNIFHQYTSVYHYKSYELPTQSEPRGRKKIQVQTIE